MSKLKKVDLDTALQQIPEEDLLESPKDMIIAIVLDKSGSMEPISHSVVQSFNDFIDSQREIPAETYVTLCIFDTIGHFWLEETPIADVPALGEHNYIPSGFTALYDSIMDTIALVDTHLDKNDMDTLFVVITDGQENSSRRYIRQDVADAIAAKTEQGWKFIYLSADADAFGDAQSISIPSTNTVQWQHDPMVYAAASDGISLSTSSIRYSRSGTYNLASSMAYAASESGLDPSQIVVGHDSEPTPTEEEDG